MPNILNYIQIDETHCQAIREEIGERLRIELKVSPPMSLKLVQLLARLPELDYHDAPSIVPSHEDADRMTDELADAI
jgi:hypothetical protein